MEEQEENSNFFRPQIHNTNPNPQYFPDNGLFRNRVENEKSKNDFGQEENEAEGEDEEEIKGNQKSHGSIIANQDYIQREDPVLDKRIHSILSKKFEKIMSKAPFANFAKRLQAAPLLKQDLEEEEEEEEKDLESLVKNNRSGENGSPSNSFQKNLHQSDMVAPTSSELLPSSSSSAAAETMATETASDPDASFSSLNQLGRRKKCSKKLTISVLFFFAAFFFFLLYFLASSQDGDLDIEKIKFLENMPRDPPYMKDVHTVKM